MATSMGRVLVHSVVKSLCRKGRTRHCLRIRSGRCCCLVIAMVMIMSSLVLRGVVAVITPQPYCYWPWPIHPLLTQPQRYCSTAAAVTPANNPLLRHEHLPEFQAIKAEHVVPAVKTLVEELETGVGKLENNIEDVSTVTWPTLVETLERLSFPLEFAWGAVSHLNGVKNNDALREAVEQAQPLVVQITSRVAQSRPVFNGLKALQTGPATLDGPQVRILDSGVKGARLGGVDLEGEDKDNFNQIRMKMAMLGQQFSNNVLDSTKAFSLTVTDKSHMDGVPDSLLHLTSSAAAQDKDSVDPEKGPWKLTLDMPCFEPFMKHSRNQTLREQMYRAYITRASHGDHDNTGVIEDIRKLRKEQSALLGYATFADLSLDTKMADSVQEVMSLLQSLKVKSKPAAEKEYAQLEEFARSNGHEGKLNLWDLSFWSERQREQLFSFSEEELRPYFPLERVLSGMFELCSHLFGIKIQAADGTTEVWHEDVRFFNILDEQGDHIASFFLDPYSRPHEKRGGAWMDSALGRSLVMQTKPVAYLVCNQSPPVGDKPSLMNFREVETLFHEFGHGLQHMLTNVPYHDAAGINNVEWDAVEVPSQFMENWVYDWDTMQHISGHYQTGDTLPRDLFNKLVDARKYMAGSGMLRQLYFSALDMELHTSSDPWQTVMDRVAAEYTVLHPLPEDRFPCSFQHLFGGGYAAGYYSYKWAEVMAVDAFGAFEEAGLENRDKLADIGKRFRETILGLGGGTHPKDVFRQFRGRDPQPDALLRLYGLS
ncbi:PREDICTED: probable cytosolic oligopeptidase A [Branchiostoma belcheri]|uniref:oligopeptidase A n=1 Tax=Branchiostoma belcheri TaxID=7741 RepID=A0A6P5A8V5_BRABE|nr:PREDICTED: probable cytosolic oligopeptidase A [Branchiostoma belcheri]